MYVEVVSAGFGGQGVLSLGMVIARAGMADGLEVSWLPSYGPEQRGGTAHCSMILSDEPIACTVVANPDIAIVMNRPSYNKFLPLVKPGGSLFIEASVPLDGAKSREDIEILPVPAIQMANELGNGRVANMVMVGAVLARHRLAGREAVSEALRRVIPERHHHLLPLNERALDRGAWLMAEV